jgi:hypothetical protein
MMEKIEDVLAEGYKTWRDNLILCLPHLLGAVVSIGLMTALAVFAVVYFVILIGMSASSIYSAGNFDWGALSLPFILVGVLAFIIFMLVYVLAASFFKAAAAGMSLAALETGKAEWKDMMGYGSKKVLQLYIAELLIGLFNILGLVFLVPAAVALFYGPLNLAVSLAAFGIILLIAYSTFLYAIFYPITYAIVIGDTGAIEGLKKSYGFVMNNKLQVLLLLFVSMAVDTAASLLINAITSLFMLIPLLGFVIVLGIALAYFLFQKTVIVPLLYVWWSRFYMTRTGKKPVTTSGKKRRSYWKDAPPRRPARPSLSSDIYV